MRAVSVVTRGAAVDVPVVQEFPKWVTHKNGSRLVVDNAAQERACVSGAAMLSELKSAEGSTFTLKSLGA